jgi:hypothetical protein
VDETTPVIAINAIDGNDIINKANAAGGVIISGTASDAGGGTDIAGQTVTVGLNGKSYTGTVQADGTGSVTVGAADAQVLADGSQTVTADVSDKAGNAATEASRSVTVDEDLPVVAITSTGNSSTNPVRTVTGTVDVADAGSTITVWDGTAAIGTTTAAADGS